MKKKKILRFVLVYLLSGIIFFLLTLPFHKLLSVFTVTEVRPSAVLYPVLGISFGLPAALGIMTANCICDAMNGFSPAVLIEGLIPQLLYTMVPYYLWRRLMNGEEHKHRLDSAMQVILVVGAAVTIYTGGKTIGTYDIWNTIYIIGIVLIGITMPVSLVCMVLFGKKENRSGQ